MFAKTAFPATHTCTHKRVLSQGQRKKSYLLPQTPQQPGEGRHTRGSGELLRPCRRPHLVGAGGGARRGGGGGPRGGGGGPEGGGGGGGGKKGRMLSLETEAGGGERPLTRPTWDSAVLGESAGPEIQVRPDP